MATCMAFPSHSSRNGYGFSPVTMVSPSLSMCLSVCQFWEGSLISLDVASDFRFLFWSRTQSYRYSRTSYRLLMKPGRKGWDIPFEGVGPFVVYFQLQVRGKTSKEYCSVYQQRRWLFRLSLIRAISVNKSTWNWRPAVNVWSSIWEKKNFLIKTKTAMKGAISWYLS